MQPLANWLDAVLPQTAVRPAADDKQRLLVESWRKRAGAAATHGRPVLMNGGRLVVFVQNATWGNEFRHRAPSLLAGLNESGVEVKSLEVKMVPGRGR